MTSLIHAAGATTDHGGDLFSGGFSWGDQVRLAHWLAAHTGPVIVSNQATQRILELYTGIGFNVTTLNVPRLISCNGDRTPAKEILATKGLIEFTWDHG